jgi:hypothetical protein
MYRSLARVCDDFHLYIFAFDDDALNLLRRLVLPRVTVVSLEEFEDKELLEIKLSRSRAEYCWTCTPSVSLYAIEHFGLPHCTYLDADIYFFSDPRVLLDEAPMDKSVLITEHRYTPRYDKTKTSGKYCVQFVYFKNDDNGMKALRWWRNACLEACEYNPAKGLNADQKYLDDWTQRFDGVHELAHLGGGVAPWNVNSYKILENNAKVSGKTKMSEEFEIIFYHFHGLKHFKNGEAASMGYNLDKTVQDKIYRKYIDELDAIKSEIKHIATKDPHGASVAQGIFDKGVIAGLKALRHVIMGNKYTFAYKEVSHGQSDRAQ